MSTRQKAHGRARRKKRVRKKVFGEPERPRLTVFRSLSHLYAQIVDDLSGRTIVSASTKSKELSGKIAQGGPPAELLANPVSEYVARFVGADRGLKRLSLYRVGAAAEQGGQGDGTSNRGGS